MRIAIHQPNFIPYYPFFQKMQEVDLFVIMVHCQFEKNNYQNRFEYNGWNTMCVNGGLEPIIDKRYISPHKDWKRITDKYPKLKQFNKSINGSLAVTNVSLIKDIAKLLNIHTEIKYDYETELKGTDRLVDICNNYGATEYLSGISGRNYLELDKFKDIKVVFQNKDKMLNKPILDLI